MKKIFNTIKQIFIDHKVYFIRCLFNAVVVGVIIGIVCAIAVPASAADEPIESGQVVIPAGDYTFNDDLTLWNANFGEQGFTFTVPYEVTLKIPFDDYSYVFTVTASGSSIEFDRFNQIWYSGAVNGISTTQKVYMQHIDEIETIGWAYSFLGIEEAYFKLYLQSLYPDLTEAEYTAMSSVGSECYGESIKTVSLLEDVSVPSVFGNWFLNNTNGGGGGIDPDPDPDPEPSYLITRGWYRFYDDPTIDTILDFDLPFVANMDLGPGPDSYSFVGIKTIIGTTSEILYNFGSNTLGDDITVPVYSISLPPAPGADPWRHDSAKEIYVTRDVTLSSTAYEWFTSNAGRMFNPPPAPDVPDDPDPSPGDGFLATIVKGVTSIFNMQFLVIDGYVITFGGIFSACVGLSLFIWLLKVFAGG